MGLNIGAILQILLQILEFGHQAGLFDKSQVISTPGHPVFEHASNLAQAIVASQQPPAPPGPPPDLTQG